MARDLDHKPNPDSSQPITVVALVVLTSEGWSKDDHEEGFAHHVLSDFWDQQSRVDDLRGAWVNVFTTTLEEWEAFSSRRATPPRSLPCR